MNRIVDRRWTRFKQELPSIVCLSTIQIWDAFNFPDRMNLEAPWNSLFFVARSALGIFFIVYLFSSIDKFAPYIKLKHIKDTPDCPASTSKKIFLTVLITTFTVAIFSAWYINFYGTSNMYYVFSGASLLLIWALLYRAAHRVGSIKCQ